MRYAFLLYYDESASPEPGSPELDERVAAYGRFTEEVTTSGAYEAGEAAQDAFAVALEPWPRQGMPDNPAAWITTTGRRKVIDRVRRDRTLERKYEHLVQEDPVDEQWLEDEQIPDERLGLIFACCH